MQEARAFHATKEVEYERKKQAESLRQRLHEARIARARALQRLDTAERYLRVATELFESADQALEALEEAELFESADQALEVPKE